MATVAVVGVGGIGGYFASAAIAAGHDVAACVRRPFTDLVVEKPDGDSLRYAIRVETDPENVAPVDWVLLGTKVHQTAGAAPWLHALCTKGTSIAVLQNGVEHRATVAPFANDARVVPTIVYCGAELIEPGRLKWNGRSQLVVEADDAGRSLEQLLSGPSATVRVSEDFTTEAWTKLVVNAIANSITAITLRRLDVLGSPTSEPLVRALFAECRAVATAEGAVIPPDDIDRMLATWHHIRSGGTSMYYDRRDGRHLEHEAITGAVVRAADRHGIHVPSVRTIHGLLSAIDESFD
ncbi:MAG: 2-dehydropantoate 2-reductase [Acidimicrobiia bacterium]